MEIGVIGVSSSTVVKNIMNAVQLYAELLMPYEVVEDLIIDVEIDNDLEFLGHCLSENIGEDPRDFYISLNPCHMDQSLYQVLAHEMVHVKQYAMNETYNKLCIDGDSISYKRMWKDEEYDHFQDYYDSPWEIEAFGREVGLYHKWKIRNRK